MDQLRTRARLWRCVRVGADVRLLGRIVVHGSGIVVIGDGVVLDGRGLPVELFAGRSAELVIGAGCVLAPGVSLEAHHRVIIGERCRFDRLSKVLDSHFHAVGGHRHAAVAPGSVTLGDDVRVGARSIVLPGAHLEPGVELLPETVVSRRVRGNTTLRGCPARQVMKEVHG